MFTQLHLDEYNQQGCVLIENVFSTEYINRARAEMNAAIVKEAEYHGGVDYKDYGMILLCSIYGGVFLEVFDNKMLIEGLNAIHGEGCIVYGYTSSSMPPDKSNFSKRIHVDSPRFISGDYFTNTGAMILVDDFTEDNGATWYLPGSHKLTEAPTEEFFYKNAKRLIAKAGSIFFLNSRVWHAGGVNNTKAWRHSFTMNICRPWMKQRIDIPRAMSNMDLSGLSENAKQKLGFYAQVPANYDEFYAPFEQRKYKQKAE
jgi:ectoine hydroxylase-related dioxygenase (phytanoyl-CoA dioxygenase family)